MELEVILLSEINKTHKRKYCIPYMQNLNFKNRIKVKEGLFRGKGTMRGGEAQERGWCE
jgi:hypothetical protein